MHRQSTWNKIEDAISKGGNKINSIIGIQNPS